MIKLSDEIAPFTAPMVIAIMVLCIADATFTLIILEHGGTEINPFMDKCIKINHAFFSGLSIVLQLCVL